ncbi:aminopeptidase N [Altererythrobacter atlanticus]|uniref:Aminopeptidase n=1 Tax=Croceibacterium atlanticum TaxID=1267766 RepID=A0A0F7KRL5_9SPHN|nr:M1 family metallopeptidase [Croceibacterium atlanticum]AKH43113.1 Aminopeptidase N [Croceibacterium atlanticum]MBB5732183.1 aminopeptidase N [Croceibacterium atlanticum]
MKRLATSALSAILLASTAPAAFAADNPAAPAAPLPESVPSDLPRTAAPTHYAIDFTPDMEALTFTGTEVIDLEVFSATDTLVLNAEDLELSEARLTPLSGGSAITLTPTPGENGQTVKLTAGKRFKPGKYKLALGYSGTIRTQASGLFALDYPDKRTGEEVRALFTQFEAPDARAFAPMFDEPSYKATFDLSATVPADLMPLSNMPVKSVEKRTDGTKHVTFLTSPKMSSYLLFFGLGDFERLSMAATDGTDVGIVGPVGSGEQSRYALESLAPLMSYFGDYFGVPFPLPKLDNIAGPGQSQFFGAMENWGAIFTFERILLEDPAIASPATRQNIFSVQAHETAHQWFGDIVTMAWWDDLWLNEGFASWLETKATDHFNPDWHWLLGRVGGREAAMGLDSFVTTHPVVQEIRTATEAEQAFDTIAYQKGEAVISMLEAYAGEDVWRDGIRNYVQAHKYGNTVSNDLWQAVEQAGATGITAIANDFTRQPGVPLVLANARCTGGNTTLTLKQSEFSRDRKEEVAANPQSWRVPIFIENAQGTTDRHVLHGEMTLTIEGCGPVVVNGGQLGYFRTLYQPEMIAKLTEAMPTLKPIDQLGLTTDNLALAQAGYQKEGLALDLLAAIPADANPVVADGTIGRWGGIYGLLEDENAKGKLASLVEDMWLPRLQQLGFEPVDGEPVATSNLRAELISTLGAMGNAQVLEQASTRFGALADDPRALDGPLKTTWLNIASRNITPEQWDMLAELARNSTSSTEQMTYYARLGAAKEETLAKKALDLALTGEAGTGSATIITTVAGKHPKLAFDFMMANREKVEAMLDSSGRGRFFARIAASMDDPEMLGQLEALRDSLPEDERITINRALVSLKQRFESQPRRRAEVKEWLAAR